MTRHHERHGDPRSHRKGPRHYWPLSLVAIVGALTMQIGAVRIDDPLWVYAWIGAVGVVSATVGIHVKRRIERQPAVNEERSTHASLNQRQDLALGAVSLGASAHIVDRRVPAVAT